MNTITAHIEHGKDGSFGIYTEYGALPFIVVGNGNTLEEAKADFKEVWDASLVSYTERTGETIEANYKFV